MKFAISLLLLVCLTPVPKPTSFFDLGMIFSGFSATVRTSAPLDTAQPRPTPVDPHALISKSARKHRVPAAFIKSIMAAESNFNCDALSSKGAVGLMQLMPETAKEYGADPTIPDQNVDAGTHYLRDLMDRYHKCRNPLPRVIAAYNAGPAVVDRYHGIPPFRETRRYVARVLGFLRRFRKDNA